MRGEYLVDERIIAALIRSGEDLVLEASGTPVAAWVEGSRAGAVARWLQGNGTEVAAVRRVAPGEITSAVSRKLRRVSSPFVLQVTPANRRQVEHFLFNEVYKGVTDLVTKWIWPLPAEQVVRFCASRGVRPNHVTALSWILAIASGILFYSGHLAWGLVPAWIMTFLDTVDGKLARVTVDSSRFGHFFDHGLDLVHPPLWYLAWGLGLPFWRPAVLSLSPLESFWLLLGGYVGGRLVEGIFKEFLAGFSLFTWRPLDSANRLITARRNPCLILLTLSLFAGRPDLGCEAVVLWTGISTGFLLLRLGLASYEKACGKPLNSWLDNADPQTAQGWERWFLETSPAAQEEGDHLRSTR